MFSTFKLQQHPALVTRSGIAVSAYSCSDQPCELAGNSAESTLQALDRFKLAHESTQLIRSIWPDTLMV